MGQGSNKKAVGLIYGGKVGTPPQKTVGLNLFFIFVTSAHIQSLEPHGPTCPLFIWVELT